MKNIPNRIYLQVDPENEKPESFNELSEITWCIDKINNNDIPYYRHNKGSRVEPEVKNFLQGDFVKFKIGCIMHYGMINEKNKDGSYEVSYTSKKIFDNTIKRFGIENLPQKLNYFGDEEAENLIKIEGMKNWNDY